MSDEVIFFGLRQDGRKPAELRHLNISVGVVDNADGSSLFSMGNTKVMAFVYGPKQTKYEKEKGGINCYFSSAHFSTTGERKKIIRGDKKSSEFEEYIKDMMESVVLQEIIPHSDIDIHIVLLQDDGGVESTAINAATLALIDAGVPMKDFLISCSSGYYKNTAILDVAYSESANFSVISEFKVAMMGNSGLLTYINYEQFGSSKLSLEVVKELTAFAVEGCKQIHFFIKEYCIKTYSY
jgi:exosome complex component RRP41